MRKADIMILISYLNEVDGRKSPKFKDSEPSPIYLIVVFSQCHC